MRSRAVVDRKLNRCFLKNAEEHSINFPGPVIFHNCEMYYIWCFGSVREAAQLVVGGDSLLGKLGPVVELSEYLGVFTHLAPCPERVAPGWNGLQSIHSRNVRLQQWFRRNGIVRLFPLPTGPRALGLLTSILSSSCSSMLTSLILRDQV